MRVEYDYFWKRNDENDCFVKIYFKTKLKKFLVADLIVSRTLLDIDIRNYFGSEVINHLFGFRRMVNYYIDDNYNINKYYYRNYNWMRKKLQTNYNYYVFIRYNIWFKLFYIIYSIKTTSIYTKPFRKIYSFIKNNYSDFCLWFKTKFNHNKNIDALTEFYHSK